MAASGCCCSTTCQKRHWPQHAKLCVPRAPAPAMPRHDITTSTAPPAQKNASGSPSAIVNPPSRSPRLALAGKSAVDDVEVRLDPQYRRQRIATMEASIGRARAEGKSLMITLARVDQDVLDLAARCSVRIVRGSDDMRNPSRTAPAHDVCLWCPLLESDSKVCSNPVCASVALPGTDKFKTCSACVGSAAVTYCSKACQVAHWATHKLCCDGRTRYRGAAS